MTNTAGVWNSYKSDEEEVFGMTKFTKKDIIILAIIALALLAVLTAFVYSQFPDIDWEAQTPYPAPNAAFVFINYDFLTLDKL